jgi:hypothetical protein
MSGFPGSGEFSACARASEEARQSAMTNETSATYRIGGLHSKRTVPASRNRVLRVAKSERKVPFSPDAAAF